MIQEKISAIPPFETGAALLSRLSYLTRPKQHLTVNEWAIRNMAHYDSRALPFLAEIMDALSDPRTSEVGDMARRGSDGRSTMIRQTFWSASPTSS